MDETGKVDLDSIDRASTEAPPLPDSKASQERDALSIEVEQFKRELGWIGRPFGGRREKPGNISIVVIICCFVGMFGVYLYPPAEKSGISFERVFGGLTSVVTLILGYLFGSSEKPDK